VPDNDSYSGRLIEKHINWKMRMAYSLNFIVKGEGLLKVTGSHVHWKSDMSEIAVDRDVTTGH